MARMRSVGVFIVGEREGETAIDSVDFLMILDSVVEFGDWRVRTLSDVPLLFIPFVGLERKVHDLDDLAELDSRSP